MRRAYLVPSHITIDQAATAVTFDSEDRVLVWLPPYLELDGTCSCGVETEVREPEVNNTIEVSRLQALARLLQMGLLDQVNSIVNTHSNPLVKLAYDNAIFFSINSPLLVELSAQLGWSNQELQDFFNTASTIYI